MRPHSLSPREMEVIEAVCRLGGNQQAASLLRISLQTVKNTLSEVYKKTHTHSAGQAAYLLWYPGPNGLSGVTSGGAPVIDAMEIVTWLREAANSLENKYYEPQETSAFPVDPAEPNYRPGDNR